MKWQDPMKGDYIGTILLRCMAKGKAWIVIEWVWY